MQQKSLTGPFKLPLSGKVDKIVIFLHGVGADGYDLLSLSDDIAEALPQAAFLSPHAPFPYDSYSVGYQWFSLADYSPDKLYQGIEECLPILRNYIDQSLEKFQQSYKDLVLIGFSQGTMMALHAAPRLPEKCHAVIGFSGALVNPRKLSENLVSTPHTLLIHGKDDQVVPAQASSDASIKLEKMHIPTQIHLLSNLGHSINNKGLELAKKFLSSLAD